MIIITAPVHLSLLDALPKKGYEYLYAPDISYTVLSEKIHVAKGLIVSTRIPIDQPMLEKAIHLKWIGRLGSGMELIDVAFAEKNNILCFSSPEGNRNAVAEHALGMLLSFMHNIQKSAAEVKKAIWLRNENRGVELAGKTIGIIGYGNTGASFAKLLTSFDVNILAHDKYKSGFGNQQIQEVGLDFICKNADVISLHLPLSAETIHYANADFFNSVEKIPIIINTARGKIIDTTALLSALQNEKISGALLDVLENEAIEKFTEDEKAAFEFLVNQKNVLITPHIAGYSTESYYKMGQILLEKIGI